MTRTQQNQRIPSFSYKPQQTFYISSRQAYLRARASGTHYMAASLPVVSTRRQTTHLADNLRPRPARRLKRVGPRALLLRVLACSVVFGERRLGAEAVHVTEKLGIEDETFSPRWLEKYRAERLGCDAGRGSYVWRHNGFGSNINSEPNERACCGRGVLVCTRCSVAPQNCDAMVLA